jgi:hypothetical protein
MVSRRKKRIKDHTGPFISFFSPVSRRGSGGGRASYDPYSWNFTPPGLFSSSLLDDTKSLSRDQDYLSCAWCDQIPAATHLFGSKSEYVTAFCDKRAPDGCQESQVEAEDCRGDYIQGTSTKIPDLD